MKLKKLKIKPCEKESKKFKSTFPLGENNNENIFY